MSESESEKKMLFMRWYRWHRSFNRPFGLVCGRNEWRSVGKSVKWIAFCFEFHFPSSLISSDRPNRWQTCHSRTKKIKIKNCTRFSLSFFFYLNAQSTQKTSSSRQCTSFHFAINGMNEFQFWFDFYRLVNIFSQKIFCPVNQKKVEFEINCNFRCNLCSAKFIRADEVKQFRMPIEASRA